MPYKTATELINYLSTKRVHDTFTDSSRRELKMSPGATVDRLWHYMLLNTAGNLAITVPNAITIEHSLFAVGA